LSDMGGARRTLGVQGELHTEFWWRNVREKDLLEDPSVDGRIISRWIFRKRAWSGLIWLRTGTGGGHL